MKRACFLAVALLVAPLLGARGQAPAAPRVSEDTAVFAGGCFWCIEAVYRHIKGVRIAESGFAGGAVAKPSYEQVSSGETGHAESVRVIFDPSQVSYAQLLRVFFTVAHDPTQLNRQGPDVGTQYRSAVFFRTAAQQAAATAMIDSLKAAKAYPRPIVTQVTPLAAFYRAEAYHQNYLAKHPTEPYVVINDLPKLDALKARFAGLYRSAM